MFQQACVNYEENELSMTFASMINMFLVQDFANFSGSPIYKNTIKNEVPLCNDDFTNFLNGAKWNFPRDKIFREIFYVL